MTYQILLILGYIGKRYYPVGNIMNCQFDKITLTTYIYLYHSDKNVIVVIKYCRCKIMINSRFVNKSN